MAGEHQERIEPLFLTHSVARERAANAEPPDATHPLWRYRVASLSPPLVAGFAKAIDLVQRTGLEAMEARSQGLADYLRAGVKRIECCSLTGPDGGVESCGLVAVALEGWEPAQVVSALWDRWRIAARAVRHPAAVRFSVAAFNNEADIDRVIEALGVLSEEAPPAAADK
jgi:selenocysteine lyase/cysteine desulfurase